MFKHILATASIAAIALASTSASAQNVNATPNYETVRLNPGFANDPYVVYLDSGGSIAASGISDSCRGYISNAPDVRLRYGSGSGVLPLIFGAISSRDTTLVVNAPDGRWYCDDDRGEGVNPLVRFNNPMAGDYEIWVGTYGSTDLLPAELYITELEGTLFDDLANNNPPQPAPNNSRSVRLVSGFAPDPHLMRVQSGGGLAASSLASGCAGYVDYDPDVQLNFQAGSLPLYISADSMADTTLAVRAPNGSWYCDDDSGEGFNPRIWLQIPLSGQYDIYVGTYGSSDVHSAELNISELYSE